MKGIFGEGGLTRRGRCGPRNSWSEVYREGVGLVSNDRREKSQSPWVLECESEKKLTKGVKIIFVYSMCQAFKIHFLCINSLNPHNSFML